MTFIYNRSAIGYSHLKKNVVCQDYSDLIIKDGLLIVTACDGHGGKIYVRSDKGSKVASDAIINIIESIGKEQLVNLIKNNRLNKIKLEILCKYNELIEQHYSENPFSEEELQDLTKEEIFKLKCNFHIAYGSTLNAVVKVDDYYLCMQVGDGGVFLLLEENIVNAFVENDDNVANLTQSLCGDKVIDNFFIKAFLKNEYKGVLICTDGILTPYQNYKNLKENFIDLVLQEIQTVSKESIFKLDEFIDKLGNELGCGDDVSIAIIYEG